MPGEHRRISDPLLALLINNGVIDADQAAEVMEESRRSAGKSVREVLVDGGYVSEDDLLGMMAADQGYDVIDVKAAAQDIPPEVFAAVPASVPRMYNALPVEVAPDHITFAVADMIDPRVSDEIAFVTSKEARFVMARAKDLADLIAEHYGDASDSVEDMINSLGSGMGGDDSLAADSNDIAALSSAAQNNAVIRFVNLVLYQGVVDRASDIHFEPFEKQFRIRYRVDGALYELKAPDIRMAPAIISRIKIMAGLNISERRIPQDGRIALTVAGKPVDLRVSCLPTASSAFSESVVLRILDRGAVSLDLENVGLPEDVYDDLTIDIEKPNGIIVVTGPTGSGKTTTLYSVLRRINQPDTKLLTAEEPVEYDMEGIVQVPIDTAAGNTFPKVLRAFLRQDPDVMMIGEIRDLETAEIAIQAALTGHLVFSTLHTNDAAGAVMRFIDMNVAPYMVSSTLESVLGQRLVRTICSECKTAYEPDDETLQRLNLTRDQIGGRQFCFGKGCKKCNGTGYKGRKGVFEYLRVNDPIRELINNRAPTLVIREKARELGMRTMREDGIRNILDAYTTVDEVLRYT